MSDPVKTLISALIKDGKDLARLLSEVKNPSNRDNSITRQERLTEIQASVTKLILEILKEVENFQVPASFPEKIIPKVLGKIKLTLEEFSKLDSVNAQAYEDLVKRVNECKSYKQASVVGSSSPTGGDHSTQTQASTSDSPQADGDKFARLDDSEKQCLFCFCLFDVGKEVRKREPIHLWIGMDLVNSNLQGAEMLDNLVAEGLIERTLGNKKLCNIYKMNEIVRKMVIEEMKIKINTENSLSVMDQQQHQPQQQPPQQPQGPQRQTSKLLNRLGSTINSKNQDDVDVRGTLVININENILKAKTFEQLSKKKNNVKVLHLGTWHHNSKRYIMVEDIEALKALTKYIGIQVTFLSLQGVSGIVDLPESIYKLENLKVLDLRACPNLESLSEGIDSLKHLTHLDLSECYLLGYIPKRIKFLTELRVLKGFVINPEDFQEEKGKENKNGNNALSCALFSDLSNLKELIKLGIRTRKKSFPNGNDFNTLREMNNLTSLRIAWVQSPVNDPRSGDSGSFPKSLKKLELQATPKDTMPQLLRVISEDTENSLEKLYIRGGRFWDLGMETRTFRHVHTVRLRYLHELRINWDTFKEPFPELTRVEVSGCPNLIFFPCDENGVWEKA